jgi:hypothetical protein
MSDIKIARFEDNVVVREIFPWGERAWRRWINGVWDLSPDHKCHWVSVREQDVPLEIQKLADSEGEQRKERKGRDERRPAPGASGASERYAP